MLQSWWIWIFSWARDGLWWGRSRSPRQPSAPHIGTIHETAHAWSYGGPRPTRGLTGVFGACVTSARLSHEAWGVGYSKRIFDSGYFQLAEGLLGRDTVVSPGGSVLRRLRNFPNKNWREFFKCLPHKQIRLKNLSTLKDNFVGRQSWLSEMLDFFHVTSENMGEWKSVANFEISRSFEKPPYERL